MLLPRRHGWTHEDSFVGLIYYILFVHIIIEGLRAKRAYVGFWPIFIFLQDRANFSD